MRFTVVATGQFSLSRAFGFGLAASSLTQLSVVNSPIRPAGLTPAWQPASPAHTRIPKSKSSAAQPHGKRTPLACGFRRPAENLVPQTFSRGNAATIAWKCDDQCETMVWAGRPNRHAGRVRSPLGRGEASRVAELYAGRGEGRLVSIRLTL